MKAQKLGARIMYEPTANPPHNAFKAFFINNVLRPLTIPRDWIYSLSSIINCQNLKAINRLNVYLIPTTLIKWPRHINSR